MKYFRLMIILILLVPIISSVADEGHDHAIHEVTDHCSAPTEMLNITAGKNGLTYDQDEYVVPKATCIMLNLINVADDTEHDLQIDAVNGSDGIDRVHLHANASSVSSMHILTPNADTEFLIYCTIEGHQSQGMDAILVVGEGNTTVPFNSSTVMIALLVLSSIPIVQRQFRK